MSRRDSTSCLGYWLTFAISIWMLSDPNHQITKILYLFYVSEYTYVVSVALVKISILLLYLRMWPEERAGSTWFRKACFVLIALLSVFTAICIIVLGVQCHPISFSWTRWDGQHQYVSRRSIFRQECKHGPGYSLGEFTVITDWLSADNCRVSSCL